jgi:molybdopterin synthase catalytic subunit
MSVDVTALIQSWKKEPEFVRRVVGMVFSHHGLVRGTRRSDAKGVTRLVATPAQERIESLRREYEQYPGIYRIAVEAYGGSLEPADPLPCLVVAGDIREHVKPVLAELLDRIKAEGVKKEESVVAE